MNCLRLKYSLDSIAVLICYNQDQNNLQFICECNNAKGYTHLHVVINMHKTNDIMQVYMCVVTQQPNYACKQYSNQEIMDDLYC